MAGKLSLEKLITLSMPLDKINEAFDVMFAGKRFVTKQIVAFTVNIISLSMLIARLLEVVIKTSGWRFFAYW